MPDASADVDVVIVGGGLCGLSLARQLLLNSNKRILLLERRENLPPSRQKVGESLVQLGGYYFSKVLQLEEHLLRDHYLKYNLRFFYRTEGPSRSYEDYGQSFIRHLSNVASYQLDRNVLESELFRLNRGSHRFECLTGVKRLDVSLAPDEAPHEIRFEQEGRSRGTTADWLVDCSGRGRFLAKRLGLHKSSPIRHGASYLWVEGLLDVERLTDRTPKERRLAPDKAILGHLPTWLATNHFVGRGFWLWVIPLRDKTSLGIVYDRESFDAERVSTPQRLRSFICETFPLFERELPSRRVAGFSRFVDTSYDCTLSLSGSRWAVAGDAGRFSDPLYSPGADLIALHNTLVTDAITTADRSRRRAKARLYETLLWALYEAYVPGYVSGYDLLDDQECFALKYTWELTIYFAFYVFPFINDLFTNERFLVGYLRRFARLADKNRAMQEYLRAFAKWKRGEGGTIPPRCFHDFMKLGPLRRSEATFLNVGLDPAQALAVVDEQLRNLDELARFVVAHVESRLVGEPRARRDARFVAGAEGLASGLSTEAARARFHPASLGPEHVWSFDPDALSVFDEPTGETKRVGSPASHD